jgi:hypothetical protein
VKDEGSNLNIMIIALNSIVGCEILGSKEAFKELVLNMFFLRHVNMQH